VEALLLLDRGWCPTSHTSHLAGVAEAEEEGRYRIAEELDAWIARQA